MCGDARAAGSAVGRAAGWPAAADADGTSPHATAGPTWVGMAPAASKSTVVAAYHPWAGRCLGVGRGHEARAEQQGVAAGGGAVARGCVRAVPALPGARSAGRSARAAGTQGQNVAAEY